MISLSDDRENIDGVQMEFKSNQWFGATVRSDGEYILVSVMSLSQNQILSVLARQIPRTFKSGFPVFKSGLCLCYAALLSLMYSWGVCVSLCLRPVLLSTSGARSAYRSESPLVRVSWRKEESWWSILPVDLVSDVKLAERKRIGVQD
jgi:hypothetical protein